MNIMCKALGHRMYSRTSNICGASYCKRWKCLYTEPGLKWPRDYPPVPKTKGYIFKKLKSFYAQPIDGYWPLRPCWVPDLGKPPRHKSRFSGEIVTNFRRFTYEEFCQILDRK